MSDTPDDDVQVPRTGNVLDLDKLEAQRREGRGDALQVKWQGVDYRLPVELPMEAVEQLSAMAEVPEVPEDARPEEASAALKLVSQGLDGGLAVLFCTEHELPERPSTWDDVLQDRVWLIGDPRAHSDDCAWRGFCRTKPSLETRMALVEGVWAAYGVSLGEALAPTRPAASGGRRSAPTSSGSTAKTPGRSTGGAKAPADRQRSTKKTAAKKAAPARKRAAAKKAAAPRRRATGG